MLITAAFLLTFSSHHTLIGGFENHFSTLTKHSRKVINSHKIQSLANKAVKKALTYFISQHIIERGVFENLTTH